MKITSRFSGTCALCGAAWSEGQECEYRRNCASICVACAAAGRVPPEKDSKPGTKPGLSNPTTPPAENDERVVVDVARRIESLLAQILAELRAARQKPSPAAPPESHAERAEGPF